MDIELDRDQARTNSYLKLNQEAFGQFNWPTDFESGSGYRVLFGFPPGEIRIDGEKWDSTIFDYLTPLVVSSDTYRKVKLVVTPEVIRIFTCWEVVIPDELLMIICRGHLPIGNTQMYCVNTLNVVPKSEGITQIFEYDGSEFQRMLELVLATAYAYETSHLTRHVVQNRLAGLHPGFLDDADEDSDNSDM